MFAKRKYLFLFQTFHQFRNHCYLIHNIHNYHFQYFSALHDRNHFALYILYRDSCKLILKSRLFYCDKHIKLTAANNATKFDY